MKRTHASRFARFTALLLTLCLLAGMMPAAVFAENTDPTIIAYADKGEPNGKWHIASFNTADQSDYTIINDDFTNGRLYGLEMINDTIYGVYEAFDGYDYFYLQLVILKPDFTIKETVGKWLSSSAYVIDTTVQGNTLWGTYNDADLKSYLIPINLTNGIPEYDQKREITGLPENEIIYTIACDANGQMYAIAADGGDYGGLATLYEIDTTIFKATRVGSTGVNTNYVSSSAFAPNGTLYWSENDSGALYAVDPETGEATRVKGNKIGGGDYDEINAMMIPRDSNVAYINFIIEGEGSVILDGEEVSGWTDVDASGNLELTFKPDTDHKIKELKVNGKEQECTGNSITLDDLKFWSTVEVTFQSKNITIEAKSSGDILPYQGRDTLNYHPTFESTLYFIVKNGPVRHTPEGVSNYEVSFEKDGVSIDKKDLVPGTYDIHVTREADGDWNTLDTVLKDGLTISKQTIFPLWHDLEMTANPGDTLADIEKPTYLVSSLDGKQIPGTFSWVDKESTPVGELGESTRFKFRFVPAPLSDDLAALYDFSSLPENGYEGWSNVTVVEEGSTAITPIPLPVRTLEEGDTEYVPASGLSAKFVPDVEVSAGEFGDNDGLRIDYYNPMEDTEAYGSVSKGYDIQVEYNVTIPLVDYSESTLKGTLTVPLPSGYDGKSARLKESGTKAKSSTKTTVSFPVTLKVENGTASVLGLMVEYKKAKSGSQTSHSKSSGSSASPLPLAPGASYQPPEPGEPAQPGESGEPAQSGGNPGSFKSDTTSDFTVSGAYQFRITSLNGAVPVMTVSNANFRVELASQEGSDYFFKIYAQGAAGSTALVSVNGTPLLTATVGGSATGVISDTTAPFTVAQGGTYQFRLTASERPSFAAGSASFTVEYAGQIGGDYFYKVHAVGNVGDGCGFYINGEAAPVAVATIA